MDRMNYRIDAKEIIIELVKNPIVYLRLFGIVRTYVFVYGY